MATTQTPTHPTSPLLDILTLFHLFNGIGSGVGVMIGYIITNWHYGLEFQYGALLSAVLATVLISCGGFIVNDIHDIEIDRVNRPDRPLAAGKVPVSLAWWLYLGTTIIGIVLAWSINPLAGSLSVLIALALLLYSFTLKKRFLVGHLTIATLGAVLFPYGGIAAGYLFPTVYSILFTFPAFIAREILKTVPDYEGDKANGVDNIATRYGPQTALRMGQIALAMTALMMPLIALVWSFNRWWFISVLVVIWPITFYTLYRATVENVTSIIRLSKIVFLLAAAALLIGSIPGA